MNRTKYFNYIEEKLNILAARIYTRGKLNVLDLHVHSENFFLHFFNELFGWNLENLNTNLQNVEAIDLIDHENKIIIQVSATNTKAKIESALKKDILKKYSDYNFKFISISKEANNLRIITYTNPHGINFNPSNDIYDIASILNNIKSLKIEKQKSIYQLIKKELGNEVDIIKLDSNLATIINILSVENWDKNDQPISTNSFEIERKISFNNLNTAKLVIEDYKIHYNRVDKKYSEFDALGVNKSSAVLATIRTEYIKNMKAITDDELFYLVIDNIKEKVIQSANYVQIPIDELEICVNIFVVDAFIRCKIFKNPENYNYVTT
ncbi:MAG: hypothetical protein EPN82_07460 [Bacteroidetes bacterium]|nr:MAG: hypothetical protein EPN82_07460 [Bacteroidota bacterium]